LKRNRKKGDKKKKTSTTSVSQADVATEEAANKEIGSDGEEFRKSETPTPEVDEEGTNRLIRQGWKVIVSFSKHQCFKKTISIYAVPIRNCLWCSYDTIILA